MRINNNLMAMNTHRQLGIGNANGSKSMEKLSSGYRINRAGDDAAGLAISEKMRGQIRGLNQASRNAQDSISLIQTAEGALTETHAILQRMRELAVQSANDTNVDVDRSEIQKEINQLTEEITRIAETTEFNTQSLLDGTMKDVKFQIGANQNQNMALSINNMSADALNVISNTIEMGSKGSAITGVKADLDFDLKGVELTATKGGAVAAKLTAKADGIDTDGFARDIEGISAAAGVDTSGVTGGDVPTFKLLDGTENQIKIEASGDFAWGNIDATKTATIDVTKTDKGLKVEIAAEDADGNIISVTDEFAQLDADGNYVYQGHGVSFMISGDDFDAMDENDFVQFDIAAAQGLTGADEDATGTIGTKNSWTTNEDGTAALSDAAFAGNKIEVDYAKLIDGAASVQIQGAQLNSDGNAKFTVTIFAADGTTELSKDEYTFALAADSQSFSFDNHGIKFDLTHSDAVTLDIKQNIETFNTKVTIANTDALKFDITDDNGNKQSIEVSLAAKDYSLDEIKDAINAEVAKSGGTFAGDVANIDGNSLTLNSAFAGSASAVEIKDAGGFASIFGGVAKATGGDSSVELTLKDKDGNSIDTATIAPTTNSVTFEDASGNQATFSLKGYANLDNVDVPRGFAASNFNREVSGIDVSTHEAANEAITVINEAIESVSAERSKLGAVQNRLEHTIKNLDTSAENLQASESRIRDVDMAKEMMEFTKNNILTQAAQAMLAQANQAPQGVLQLLR